MIFAGIYGAAYYMKYNSNVRIKTKNFASVNEINLIFFFRTGHEKVAGE
jgi:hypothetical protein